MIEEEKSVGKRRHNDLPSEPMAEMVAENLKECRNTAVIFPDMMVDRQFSF